MAVTINGTTGVAVPLGSASAPAETNTTSSTTGIYYPTSTTLGLSTNGTNAVTIGASQNVGIGITAPANLLDVQNISTSQIRVGYVAGGATQYYDFGRDSSDGLFGFNGAQTSFVGYKWKIQGTEAMRIDSSGNLLVGTATANAQFNVLSSSNVVSGRFQNAITSGTTVDILQTLANQAAGTGFYLARFYSAGTPQFAVRGDGTVYAQNTTIQSLSDERLKENITDSADGLDVILGLKTRRFDWKEGYGNNRKNQLGFIAQEVETVFPEAVDVWEEGENERTEYKSVGPSALIPVLVKAIQELSAKNDALETRLAALESK